MRRLLAILLVVVLSHPLTAQTRSPGASLIPGSRVRITLREDEPRIGVLVGTVADTILVRWPEFSSVDRVPLALVELLEVTPSGQHNVLKRAGMGVVVGAGVGALAGAVGPSSGSFIGRGALTAAAATGGATLGLLVGTVVGLWRGEDWHEVSTSHQRLDAAVVPHAHGFGVAVSRRY